MSRDWDNLIKQASDQIPKGGAWITLKNIQLAINIAFDFIYEVIKLAILLTGLYYLYQVTPELSTLLNQLGGK
jgi:hypothetical protein